jgi:hypothetical protein
MKLPQAQAPEVLAVGDDLKPAVLRLRSMMILMWMSAGACAIFGLGLKPDRRCGARVTEHQQCE